MAKDENDWQAEFPYEPREFHVGSTIMRYVDVGPHSDSSPNRQRHLGQARATESDFVQSATDPRESSVIRENPDSREAPPAEKLNSLPNGTRDSGGHGNVHESSDLAADPQHDMGAQGETPSETTSQTVCQVETVNDSKSNYRAINGADEVENESGSRTLLFVHGNPTWSFYWRKLIGPLSHQYRCVAVDHVGCGRSDKPQKYRYTLEQHISNLVKLIQELDLRRITLVAHDWGGAIGLGAVTELTNRVDRIVLMNTGAFPPPYIPWRIRACRIPVLGTFALRGLNLFSLSALRMAVQKTDSLDHSAREGLVAPYDNWANRVAVDGFVKDIPASRRHPTWERLDRIEKNLVNLADRPVKLIWGMRDWCFRPECMERFQTHFPNADVTRLDDTGHYVVEESPDEVLHALQSFLRDTDGYSNSES